MDPLLVITNTDAGTAGHGTPDPALDVALGILRESASVEVAATKNPGELDGVLHRAGSRRIVVAGGDGTLHAVVAALHKRNELKRKTLALLPLGTGNDFARSTGIPLEIEDAARLVLDGEARPVDLLVDETGEIVVNNVHVGASARASAQASRTGSIWKSVLGKIGYPVGALLTALKPPRHRLHVEIDREVVVDVDEPVLMVAIGNGASVGGGTEVNPEADPESGLLDVMISRSVSPAAKAGFAVGLSRGTHQHRDDVIHRQGREVSVTGEAFWVSADGEVYGPERSRSWRLEPAAYAMVLPA